MIIERGAFRLFDRGYLEFCRPHVLHEAGGFFLIRAKRGPRAKRRDSRPVDRRDTPVQCDPSVTPELHHRAPTIGLLRGRCNRCMLRACRVSSSLVSFRRCTMPTLDLAPVAFLAGDRIGYA